MIVVGGNGGELSILFWFVVLVEYSVLWIIEDFYEISENIRLLVMFDLVFSNDFVCVLVYMGKVKYLFLVVSKKYYNLLLREVDDLYRYDLLFLGIVWLNCVKVINKFFCFFKCLLCLKIGLFYN